MAGRKPKPTALEYQLKQTGGDFCAEDPMRG